MQNFTPHYTPNAGINGGSVLYRVQFGAFANKENAEKLEDELIKKGYPAYVK